MTLTGGTHEQIHVLVADSNRTQSDLLTSALRRQSWMKARSCPGKLDHCLEALQSAPTDVVVLSYDASDRDHQIDTLRELHNSSSNPRLILSVDKYDRSLVVDALRAGARGIFCRVDQPFRALCRCITVVNRGDFWVSSEQLAWIVEALRLGVHGRVVSAKNVGLLTPREEQVVNLVAGGSVNREVAHHLCIKENTVKKSLLRIYDKLGVSNRVELVLYALTHRGSGQTQAARPAKPRSAGSLEVQCLDPDQVGLLGESCGCIHEN